MTAALAARARGALLIGLGAGLLLAAAPAAAHRTDTGRTDGVRIEALSHGQMAVIDANRPAVLALAAGTVETDPVFRRLFNYVKLQYTVCLWGLMPGSLDDEESPFNGCAHAYLAATRALLTYMRDRPSAAPAVVALADKVDHELLLEGTLAMCAYSGEPYNTADLIWPEWSAIPGHRPTAVATALAAGGLLALAGAGWASTRPRRRAG